MTALSEDVLSGHDLDKLLRLKEYLSDLRFYLFENDPAAASEHSFYGKLSVYRHHSYLHNYAALEDGSFLCCAQMYPYRVELSDDDYSYVLLSDTEDLSVSDISEHFTYTGDARAVMVEVSF